MVPVLPEWSSTAGTSQAFMGLGPPASLGDIAVPRDASGRVDIYTPDGQYKFGTSPFDCATGTTIGTEYLNNPNGAQAVLGCAVTALHYGIQLRAEQTWAVPNAWQWPCCHAQ